MACCGQLRSRPPIHFILMALAIRARDLAYEGDSAKRNDLTCSAHQAINLVEHAINTTEAVFDRRLE